MVLTSKAKETALGLELDDGPPCRIQGNNTDLLRDN